MIISLNQMVNEVLAVNKKHIIAVAWAQDPNTVGAVNKAVSTGMADAVMIGNRTAIVETCLKCGVDHNLFNIIDIDNERSAAAEAVKLVRSDAADVVMKGLVGTDIFLKAVMDKETGIMLPDAVLTYVCAIETPGYQKLLFVTDPAVIPYPDLKQKTSMIRYAVEMTSRFGIEVPRIALVGASEKPSHHFHYSDDYIEMCRMARDGEFGKCIMDGPLDLFLACDKNSVEIKGINTPVGGEADILMFPSLESCNPFYKSLMLFANGELAGLIRGTTKPVVLMSRSESEISKFYCIAMACLMS